MRKIINYVFYFSSGIGYLYLLLPTDFKIVGYSPSIVTYLWFFLVIPLSFLSFIYLSYKDFKIEKYKWLFTRLIIYLLFIAISIYTRLY